MGNDNISNKLLNEIFLCVSQLADSVPLGGEDYIRMVFEFYTERVLNQVKDNFKPISNKAIDLCQAFITAMDENGILDKKNYKLWSDGDSVNISIVKNSCNYFEYCEAARKNNLPWACRMNGYRWLASKYTGCNYQLKIEYPENSDYCRGTIYPGEKLSQILTKDGVSISIAGERALVISINALGLLMKTIYNAAPHILEHVFYESTYYSSELEYENVQKYFTDTYELLNYLLNNANRLGNIRYEIIKYDPENKTATIRGHGSYMAEIFKKNNLFFSPKVSCAAARGRLSAYFTKAWGKEIVCEEMKCEAFGDEFCEFILLPRHK